MRILLTTLMATSCTLGMLTTANALPSITVYLSAPDAQVAPTTLTSLSVETFDALSTSANNTAPFVSAIGTYTGTFKPNADDQYGNGTNNYFTFGAQSGTSTPVSLSFTTPIAYFGFAYCAGDPNNGVTFYDNTNAFLGRFSTSTLLTVLNNGVGTVTATDSTVYNTSQYFGKPNTTNTNTSEPYSFVNFFITGGTVGRIEFDNSNLGSTGYESDNHTISTTPQTTDGTPFVFVSNVAVVPEASSVSLLALAAIPALGVLSARRHK
ncbi:MAG: hypothetical protein H7Y38_03370 [Armatimonadetes bacterium]|nr:hypothetical protein [Armatimonadota bacterium]